MFLEPHYRGQRSGWIEVICGSMFSGKTEELIRRLKRARIANQHVEVFKPIVDVRYDERKVVSHDENAILAAPIANSAELLKVSEEGVKRTSVPVVSVSPITASGASGTPWW